MNSKLKKKLIIIMSFFIVLLSSTKIFANNNTNLFNVPEYTEEYKQWLELPEEKKKDLIQPRMFEIPKTYAELKNPLKLTRMLKSNLEQKYTLRDYIPENVIVKNQEQTNSCWAFGILSSLETNLALRDYYNGEETKVYDFSERHMEYATSRFFENGAINEWGLNRKVGSGGNRYIYMPYLTNGIGAIKEDDMPFENNENTISMDKIQNKEVVTEVYDTVEFPSYSHYEDHTEIKQKMKQHIVNYGSIEAGIHGASLGGDCYNNDTGAIYCDNTTFHPLNHSISIIGWDDNYSIDNFNEKTKPKDKGAWIIKNSWGTKIELTLQEMKEEIFNVFSKECIENGWTDATKIPDEKAKVIFSNMGYTIEGDKAILKLGDNGIMYISYEDVNIYKQMTGIVKSSNNVQYENIYQYNEFGNHGLIEMYAEKVYIANVFQKKTKGKEYITKVSINAPETYTCKVYINPNGTGKSKEELQLVDLETGETETFDAGYHTIEFLKPVEIKSDNFVVVVEATGVNKDKIGISAEANFDDVDFDDVVKIEDGKCFATTEIDLKNNAWQDLSKIQLYDGSIVKMDSTIKAFTVSNIPDDSLKDIQITKKPNKTEYIEGENFDTTGMEVRANYNNGKSNLITNYNIIDGTNLKSGQTEITIEYEGKTTTQAITVEKNSVTSIRVKTQPAKTTYFEGEDFDKTGMIVEATYKNGEIKEIDKYVVKNGNNLTKEQTTITIEYEGQTATQEIKVIESNVASIRIKTPPAKTTYFEGQDFDKTGMIVEATYKDETVKEITDYQIKNGTNLKKENTEVTVVFEGKTTTQAITVKENSLLRIEIKTPPTKTTYFEGEDFDKTGMVINAVYENGDTKEITEYVIKDGENLKLEQSTVTISFENKTVTQKIVVNKKIIEKPENSNFNSAKAIITRVQAQFYSNKPEESYTLIDVEVSNIEESKVNDKCEYYYYLSPKQEENSISNWVKIEKAEIKDGKLVFTINSKDISNYEEVSNSETLYLYIKEVATKGKEQSVVVTKSMKLETPKIDNTYVDGEDKDTTIADKELPNTGKIIVGILLAIIMTFAVIKFIRYKNLKDIK